MGAAAEIDVAPDVLASLWGPLAGVAVEGDDLALDTLVGGLPDALEDLDLVGLVLEDLQGLRQLHLLPDERLVLGDDPPHLSLDVLQVLGEKGAADVEVVVEAVLDRWPDGVAGVRPQRQDRLCHHVRGRVPEDVEVRRGFGRNFRVTHAGDLINLVSPRVYEQAVAAGFDAAGPYDRLIWIYQSRKAHRDVIRVAEASVRNVRTYPAKKLWYEEQIAKALADQGSSPQPRPR